MLLREREMAGPAWGLAGSRERQARLGPDAGQPPETWSLIIDCGVFLV